MGHWVYSHLLLVYLCILMHMRQCRASYDYKVDVFTAKFKQYRQKYVGKYNIDLSQENGVSYLGGNITIILQLDAMSVRIKFDKIRKDKSKINLLTTDLDMCKLVSDNFVSLKALMKIIKKNSNVPLNCPIRVGEYFMKKVPIKPEYYMPIVPGMNFYLVLEFRSYDWHEMDLVLTGALRKIK